MREHGREVLKDMSGSRAAEFGEKLSEQLDSKNLSKSWMLQQGRLHTGRDLEKKQHSNVTTLHSYHLSLRKVFFVLFAFLLLLWLYLSQSNETAAGW